MFRENKNLLQVAIHKSSSQLSHLPEFSTYAVASLMDKSYYNKQSTNGSSQLLVRLENIEAQEFEVLEDYAIPIPDRLDPEHAMLAPLVALALWGWDCLGLELGELAVYTGIGPLADIVGQIAIWSGAQPLVKLSPTRHGLKLSSNHMISSDDLVDTAETLKKLAFSSPGFAAVDLTGRPEIVDLLLEIIPKWGRLLLGSNHPGKLTIDYYKNIHRKAALVVTNILTPDLIFHKEKKEYMMEYLQRAYRILLTKPLAENILESIHS